MPSIKSLAFISSTLLPFAAAAPPAPEAFEAFEDVEARAITYADGVVVAETPPVVTPGSITHGSFTGTPTVTGALTAASVLASALSPLPPPPAATTYPSDGSLHEAMPAPYVPGGGLGTNGTMPAYMVQSDYDYQSVALALYMEWLQYDLFQTGLQQFSEQDFISAGLTADARQLFSLMSEQAVGHITLLTNILGSSAPEQCQYNYPFNNIQQYIDFCQKVTRVTESTVYGFLPHLDSRSVASLLLGSVSISARQQMIFRQLEGLFPMPVWFEAGVPQSWGWSLIAPFIAQCPDSPRLVWQNFPALTVVSQPNPFGGGGGGGGTSNRTSGVVPGIGITTSGGGGSLNPSIAGGNATLSTPGRTVSLSWGNRGTFVGPSHSYVTTGSASTPSYVAWVTQLNVTYTALSGASVGANATSGTTTQPDLATFMGDPAVNGTVFVAITDTNLYVTPFNVSMINPHVVAGPALYQAG